MNRTRWTGVALATVVVAVVAGCGGKAKQESAQVKLPPGVVLPEWAPKNPSPEFIRAATVLKPMPADTSPGAQGGGLSAGAFEQRFHRALPAAWEFFGALSDEQIQGLRSTKSLHLGVAELAQPQRAAMDRFFATWRSAMQGLPADPERYTLDYVADLHRLGAAQDLSNVDIELAVRGSGIVAMLLRVRRPDGTMSPPAPVGLGQM